MRSIKTGRINIGDGHPVFIIAEIGINHNGSIAKLFTGDDALMPGNYYSLQRDPEVSFAKLLIMVRVGN